ncbi:L-seryl-tRNA(Sec) selenium transferase [Neobacillus niacini]|uniref:L-seryl-tRNA(Sec) selenium transferase n=1 Tax=Neobacillus niacini TaxID=86668 RepID=UPI00285F3956|nr:L-seryl-tRNA(Sec) selenium transferase [Neobacillus niacini]MDR7001946.1 L-seryl-tRNA(Ser) seleniumtransferase [Neobacillus niacini]
MRDWLHHIPAVHELQGHEQFPILMEEMDVDFTKLTQQIKDALNLARASILNGSWHGAIPGSDEFIYEIFQLVKSSTAKQLDYTLKRVINATGTILHTNLGRARLSDKAVLHVLEIAQNYSNLEYKLLEGERGSRHSHVESLIKELTGAEAAMVVNNNAAAVYLVLRALASGKEVIVSRGQLVEIGGSFRISSIMEESGARLVEVGTTNKTHLYDYEQAMSQETAIVMKVHTSNFKMIGFTESINTHELIQFTQRFENVIFYEDLGSGALYDLQKVGIGEEPVVRDIIDAGADIVTFSGDKLLGGPQAGIIAGKKKLIDCLKKHQLARVVRVDKMTLAALEGTLIDYVRGEQGVKSIPAIRDLCQSVDVLESRSAHFIGKLLGLSSDYQARTVSGTSQVGGGTMPEVEIPTVIIALKHRLFTAEQLAKKLRADTQPAIVARIQKDEYLIDLRTVSIEEEDLLLKALLQL